MRIGVVIFDRTMTGNIKGLNNSQTALLCSEQRPNARICDLIIYNGRHIVRRNVDLPLGSEYQLSCRVQNDGRRRKMLPILEAVMQTPRCSTTQEKKVTTIMHTELKFYITTSGRLVVK